MQSFVFSRGVEAGEKQPTQNEINDYVRHGSNGCPFCGDESLTTAGSVEIGSNFVRHPVRCLECGVKYRERFTLVGLSKTRSAGGEDYFFADTEADETIGALMAEVRDVSEQLERLGKADSSLDEAMYRLLRVLNRVAPEVVQHEFPDFAPRVSSSFYSADSQPGLFTQPE
jgi:hypothetical protein